MKRDACHLSCGDALREEQWYAKDPMEHADAENANAEERGVAGRRRLPEEAGRPPLRPGALQGLRTRATSATARTATTSTTRSCTPTPTAAAARRREDREEGDVTISLRQRHEFHDAWRLTPHAAMRRDGRFEDMDVHQKLYCGNRPAPDLPCKFGCGRIFTGSLDMLKEMEFARDEHQRNACPNRIVQYEGAPRACARARNEHRRHVRELALRAHDAGRVPLDAPTPRASWQMGAGGGGGHLEAAARRGGGGGYPSSRCRSSRRRSSR